MGGGEGVVCHKIFWLILRRGNRKETARTCTASNLSSNSLGCGCNLIWGRKTIMMEKRFVCFRRTNERTNEATQQFFIIRLDVHLEEEPLNICIVGQWLCTSWQNSRFLHQRTLVRVRSMTKNKSKRCRDWIPLKIPQARTIFLWKDRDLNSPTDLGQFFEIWSGSDFLSTIFWIGSAFKADFIWLIDELLTTIIKGASHRKSISEFILHQICQTPVLTITVYSNGKTIAQDKNLWLDDFLSLSLLHI